MQRPEIGERIVLMLWVGSLWTVGFIVAPYLFKALPDRTQAGTLAGGLFGIEAGIGLACAVLLLLSFALRGVWRAWQAWVVIGMLALTLIGHFGLTPWIADLRDQGLVESAAFARLHGLAGLLYLVNSLLGLLLVIGGLPPGRGVKTV